MPTTSTTLGGLNLDGYIYNASGVNNEILKQLQKIGDSGSSVILSKSTTIEPRKGNPNPRYVVKSNLIPGCTLNSMGLPNLGLEKTLEVVQELKKNYQKPVFVSVSGFSTDENIQLIKAFKDQGLVDAIEINLSCPNVAKARLLGYDIEAIKDFFVQAKETLEGMRFGFKLPPYFEEYFFEQLSEIFIVNKTSFLVCCNSMPNCLVIDPKKGSPIIKPNFGRGGMGGDWLKPVSLSNVNSFYRYLGDKVDIVGVGGVRTGLDAYEYLLAGASSVQIGTAFAQDGIDSFKRINQELSQILNEKGYSSVQEAKGELKYL